MFGGVGIQPQIDALRRGVDVLVATPGRLLDHVEQKTVDLRQVEILVLDEADRMLDMGFIHDIRRILALLPKTRQNLLFSATFPDEIRKLAGSFMKDPVTVEVARRNTPGRAGRRRCMHPVDAATASASCSPTWCSRTTGARCWCSAAPSTAPTASRSSSTRAGIEADAIHGNKAQNHRTRTLKRFKDNELRVLVATDIAARGLDIEALPHVVNYDLPHVAEDYVHRIGRTGRAGAEGEAVSLVSNEERPLMAAIERLMNRKVESRVIAGFEPGTPSQLPREEEPRRQHQPRQHQRPPATAPGQEQRHGSRSGSRGQRAEIGVRARIGVRTRIPAALQRPAAPRRSPGLRFGRGAAREHRQRARSTDPGSARPHGGRRREARRPGAEAQPLRAHARRHARRSRGRRARTRA